MTFPSSESRDEAARHRRIRATHETVRTAVCSGTTLSFVVGLVLFWYEDLQAATGLFLIGSILFAGKPTIRVLRELRSAVIGDAEVLARRYHG